MNNGNQSASLHPAERRSYSPPGAIGKFEDVPLEDHVKLIQTDLLGTLYGSYFAVRHFRQQGRGILINVASVIGKTPAPYCTSYAAAKHGVVGLSTAIREELKQDNIDTIRVCTVMPTTFDTPFFDGDLGRKQHDFPTADELPA